jgi:N-acyl-D-amino-acid deacylase
MPEFDVLIIDGTVIDGCGEARYVADIGISGGRIQKIGKLARGSGLRTIDAKGLIVAPGVVDLHTHYDAQIAWDPYCRSSGWHGTTTVVVGNCGFGFAPCRPDVASHERYMRMMENTEQISYSVMRRVLPWTWETFPEWLNYMRSLPKGVNLAAYVPMNALLSYVVGADEAKSRAATPTEREVMRKLLNEAMDAGASGFAFSHLGADGNSHVDFDFTAMPADVMAYEEAYNLATVLRDRGEGVIQALIEIQGMDPKRTLDDRKFLEELARISGRPVIHNMTSADPGGPEFHRGVMSWLDEAAKKGLKLYSQAFSFRTWIQMRVIEFNAWDSIPIFREFSAASLDGKKALAIDPNYRRRLKSVYKIEEMGAAAGAIEDNVLLLCPSAPRYEKYIDKSMREIAVAEKSTALDVFFDIVAATSLEAEFRTTATDYNPDYVEEILRHPRIICGASDGGAHSKFFSGGAFSTDMIVWLVKDEHKFNLEEMHNILSKKPSELFGFSDRGAIQEGYAADLMIYDYEKIGYQFGQYATVSDLPGGDWARVVQPQGIHFTIVNGEITHEHGVVTGNKSGVVLSNAHSLPMAAE